MHNDEAFDQSLALVAEAAKVFQDDWILIGSAAAKIAGADVGHINDIDLLLSERDIHALKNHWRGKRVLPAAPSDQFRSRLFYRFEAPLPIEAMAEFEIKHPTGEWMRIEPKSRKQYGALFAPAVSEQIDILKLMDRPKDAPRIEALTRLISS